VLAIARAAESVSAVCRTTINQSVTPDPMRGRMSSIYGLVVTGGPRLGDLESGTMAAAAGVQFSIVSGGVLCLLGLAVITLGFPQLPCYSSQDWLDQAAAQNA